MTVEITRERNAFVCQGTVDVGATAASNQIVTAITVWTDVIISARVLIVAILQDRHTVTIVRITRRHVAQVGYRRAKLVVDNTSSAKRVASRNQARILWLCANHRIGNALSIFTAIIDTTNTTLSLAIHRSVNATSGR